MIATMTASDWRHYLQKQISYGGYSENNRKKCQAIIDRKEAEEKKQSSWLEAQEKKDTAYKIRKEIATIKNRKKQLRNKYGITLEDYNKMLTQQFEKCAICGKHQSELNFDLFVDHDHKTGKVRGLLCCGCNTRLSALDDNVWYEKARRYLKSTG